MQKQKEDKKKNIKLSRIIKAWKSWEISNFEFLMWLNIFGNRSYNDLSQYTVFPWILSNSEDPLQIEQSVQKSRTSSIAVPELETNLANGRASSVATNSVVEDEEFVIDYQYRDMN